MHNLTGWRGCVCHGCLVCRPKVCCMLETLLVSTGIVTLAEIGDKTQLLALLLAARYRKPLPIILGILVATLANHLGQPPFSRSCRPSRRATFFRSNITMDLGRELSACCRLDLSAGHSR